MIMPFGRHKGQRVEDCPFDYLRWLLQSDVQLSHGLRRAIEEVLDDERCGCAAGPAWYARQQAEKLLAEGRDEFQHFGLSDLPEFKFEPVRTDTSAAAKQAPPSSWIWIGLIRQDDDRWRPVAQASTLDRAWDALQHYPADGDRLVIPSRPVPKGDIHVAP